MDAFEDVGPGAVKMAGGGSLEILNVGDGDTKLSFDPNNEPERKRAARIVTEMLRMGFAVMIEVTVEGEKLYRRVQAFDETKCEYIIFGDIPAEEAAPREQEAEQQTAGAPAAPVDDAAASSPRPRRGRPRKNNVTHIPAERTRAVGVARSAGG